MEGATESGTAPTHHCFVLQRQLNCWRLSTGTEMRSSHTARRIICSLESATSWTGSCITSAGVIQLKLTPAEVMQLPVQDVADSKEQMILRAVCDERISVPVESLQQFPEVYKALMDRIGGPGALAEVKVNWRCNTKQWWVGAVPDSVAPSIYRKLGYTNDMIKLMGLDPFGRTSSSSTRALMASSCSTRLICKDWSCWSLLMKTDSWATFNLCMGLSLREGTIKTAAFVWILFKGNQKGGVLQKPFRGQRRHRRSCKAKSSSAIGCAIASDPPPFNLGLQRARPAGHPPLGLSFGSGGFTGNPQAHPTI